MVSISKESARFILDAIKNYPGYGLRLGIKGASCEGEMLVGFDKPKPDDLEFDIENVKILIAKKHYMYLIGATVTAEANGEQITVNVRVA